MTTKAISTDWLNRSQDNGYFSVDKDVDRDLLLHYICKSVLGGKNYSCPFNNSMKKCLDIGYSSGYWMMEMATDFPDCEFYGIDVEPNVPDQVYPRNCFWGQGDYLKGLPYEENTFDMVHLSMSTLGGNADQISFLISEAYRVTKKGGLIEFLEPEYNPDTLGSPLLKKLMKVHFGTTVSSRNINELLIERGFININNNIVPVPLGKRSMVGEFSLSVIKLYAETIDARTKSKLNLRDEDDLQDLIEKETEQYSSFINIFSGYGQK